MEINKYTGLLDSLLDKQIAFAAWFYPGNKEPHLLVSNPDDIKFIGRFNSLNGEQGFVFAPFRIKEDCPVVLLKPGNLFNGIDEIANFNIEQFYPFRNEKAECTNSFLTKEEFLGTIEKTVEDIKNTDLSKVIMSRRISVDRTNGSLGEMFLKLQEQTPNAFCYLVNLPIAGTWMGATPEILLKEDQGRFETVSLAGTQARRNDGEYWWHTKDIEEQAFVSRYLVDIFHDYNVGRYKTRGPETMESGKVAHLRTSFFFPIEKISHCLGDFLADLHPTPAVCGLPKDLADQYIRDYEKHHRKYYTGYLGPWRLNNDLRLFVNLRCMEVCEEQLMLYAGGGITEKSVPEKEWDETIQKANTLLSVINDIDE